MRISFFGGGSDIKNFFSRNKGMVLSTTINKFVRVVVNQYKSNESVYLDNCLIFSKKFTTTHTKNEIIKNSLKMFGIDKNVEIHSFSDVEIGSGLGGSSSFAVGLIHALYLNSKIKCTKRNLAEISSRIEIDECNQRIGMQDQYAASYGGFNVIRFDSSGIDVEAAKVDKRILFDLNSNLLCFYRKRSLSANDILTNQSKELDDIESETTKITTNLVSIAEHAVKLLESGKIDDFGDMLHESWMLKRKFNNVTSQYIDEMYDIARNSGAIGGKLLGAGNGGYMLFYVPQSKKKKVIESMKSYERMEFNFTKKGSEGVRF